MAKKKVAAADSTEAAIEQLQKLNQPPAEEADAEGGKKKKRRAKKDKKKGKKRGFLGVLIPIILLGAIIAFLIFTVRFDLFGLRTRLITMVSSWDPEFRTVQMLHAELDMRESVLDIQEEDLALYAQELADWEEELTQREEDLLYGDDYFDDESGLFVVEGNLVYRETLSEERLAELKNLGKIYNNMDPEAASDIMPQLYTVSDMAVIFYYMSASNAAAVMELLDADLAAEITMAMLQG